MLHELLGDELLGKELLGDEGHLTLGEAEQLAKARCKAVLPGCEFP